VESGALAKRRGEGRKEKQNLMVKKGEGKKEGPGGRRRKKKDKGNS